MTHTRTHYLFDSDVLIWALRNHAPTVELLRSLVTDARPVCSAFTVFEVWAGARAGEEPKTRRFFEPFRVLPVSRPVAEVAALYWQTFHRQGQTPGKVDMLLAATARIHGLTLITYNRRHFPMNDIAIFEDMPAI